MENDRIDVVAVLDCCIAHAEKMIACLRHEGDERFAKQWDAEVIRQREARAAVAELIEAGNAALDALCAGKRRIGSLQDRAVYKLRDALARVQGEK